jgi:peptide/nickel transport system substrate-binding protein
MESYWTRLRTQRRSRRTFLAGATLAGAGIAITAGGCGRSGGTTSSSGPSASNSAAQQPEQTPQVGGTLAPSILYGNLPSLDPGQTPSAFTAQTAGAVLSRLFRFKTGIDPKVGTNRDMEGDLAVSAETPDALSWTIKLRSDAHFHNIAPVNGHAVESEDVRASFVRTATDAKNPFRGLVDMIDPSQIETPAKDTVVFRLKYPDAPFQQAVLASPDDGVIVPRELMSGGYDPAKQIIGSGPFLFDTYEPDVALTVKRNSAWFQQGQPYVDAIRFPIFPEVATRLAQFTGGHLDTLQVLPTDLPTMKRDNPKAAIITSLPSSTNMVFFQLGDPNSPWQDVRLRRAVSMAIDRQALGKAVFQEFAFAFNVPATFGKWALTVDQLPSDTAKYYQYNPAEAKKLLEAVGATNLSIKVGYPQPYPIAYFQPAVEAFNAMLNAIGVKTSLVAIDYTKDYLAAGKGVRYGNFPNDMIVFGGTEGGNDADEYLFKYFGSKSTGNQERLNDSTVDTMISKARTIVKDDDRVRAYIDLQKYLADKMYTVADMPQPLNYTVVQPRVQRFQLSLTHGIATETYAKLWLKP